MTRGQLAVYITSSNTVLKTQIIVSCTLWKGENYLALRMSCDWNGRLNERRENMCNCMEWYATNRSLTKRFYSFRLVFYITLWYHKSQGLIIEWSTTHGWTPPRGGGGIVSNTKRFRKVRIGHYAWSVWSINHVHALLYDIPEKKLNVKQFINETFKT